MRAGMLAAALLLAAAGSARGQLADLSRPGLVVSAGLLHGGQSDEAISPMHFVGSGPAIGLAYEGTRGRTELVSALEAGSARLSAQGSRSSERLLRATLRVGALRALGEPTGRGRAALGLELRTFTTLTWHTVGSSQWTSLYLLGGATLGPVLRYRFNTGGGSALQAELGTSLVSCMDHPYGSVDAGRPLFALRLVSPGTARAANGRIAYTAAAGRHLALDAGYGFELLDYRDLQPVRHFSQALTLGVRVRPSAVVRS